jgi:hypothetical protein
MKNTLKFFTVLSAIMILFSGMFSSCDKEEIVPFSIEFLNVPIPVGPLVAPDGNEAFFSRVFLTETEQKLNELGASFDDIESAKLEKLKLRIVNPPERTFDPIDFLDAWAFAPGVDTIKVAYSDAIPDEGLKEITFKSQYSDLSELVKQDDFTFLVKGYHNVPIPDSTYFELDFVITVKVKTKK